MDVNFRKKSNIFTGVFLLMNLIVLGTLLIDIKLNGLCIQPYCPDVKYHYFDNLFEWFPFVMVSSYLFLFIGLAYYAKAKGYSALLALLGVFHLFGFVIVVLLPDRVKQR